MQRIDSGPDGLFVLCLDCDKDLGPYTAVPFPWVPQYDLRINDTGDISLDRR